MSAAFTVRLNDGRTRRVSRTEGLELVTAKKARWSPPLHDQLAPRVIGEVVTGDGEGEPLPPIAGDAGEARTAPAKRARKRRGG